MKSHFTRIVAQVFTVGLMASLISCGSTQTTPTVSQSAQSAQTSNADPALVEASKQEAAGILIYSIMSEKNWQPVIQGFNAKYPWIKVTTADLGAYEVFERYYTEAAGNARTADFISTTAPDGWINFIDKGEVQPYVSSEDAQIPELGKIAQGVYAASTDPMVFIWNKQLVADPPQTMAELVSMIDKDPSAMQGKLVSYDADGEGFGYGLNWFYTKAKGADGWKTLEAIGSSQPKILTSGGKMIDSVLSGESSIGYFVSNITVQPRLEAAQQLLGYSFVPDAQVVAVRGMAVTKHAASPNSAKLLIDYILSAEGQMAFSQGGLTAYRPDIAATAPLHLSQVSQAVGGEQNIIFSRPDKALADPQQRSQFLNQWKQALGRNQ
ncbi:ABC transporter substrate-binding protein [Herpetosiphon gulosus]|uniref:ABC transporter substrate-binding protein n=1 Tax=Herpetosiphon gulosus TaxID=1973496 RepID=A0ABP9WYI5_9CHLR